ncbi:MAG: tetratricopeptide repeat protein [Bacteroidota bacterium]
MQKTKTAAPIAIPAKPGELTNKLNLSRYIIFVFALLLYADTIDLKYTLDDTLMITGNKFTKEGVGGIKEILTNDAFVGFLGKNNLLPGGRYRPLSQVIFAVEYQFFGLNPMVGHLLNILLYGLLCLLLFNILHKLLNKYSGSNPWYLSLPFVAALLFTAHPLHTEVVANIKGLDEILCLLGSLGVLYLCIRYTETRKWWLLALAIPVFCLAILSKENAITFLAIVPLALYFFRNVKIKELLVVVGAMLVAMIFYAAIRIGAIGLRVTDVTDSELLNNPFVGASAAQKYATILFTWLKYLILLVLPHPLTHDYYPKQIPLISFGDIRAVISLIMIAGLAAWALINVKKKSITSFAVLFFFITFSIVSNVVFNIGTFMNERFMFTALLGFALLAAVFITLQLNVWIKDKNTFRRVALFLLVIVLSGYSIKTMSRNRVWMDDLTLFTTDVKVSFNSTKCNTSAGGKLIEYSDSISDPVQKKIYVQRALPYLDKAVKIYPGNLNSWLLMGNAYLKLEDYAGARTAFENCLRINPKHAGALNNLKFVVQECNKHKQFGESVKSSWLLIKYTPQSADAFLNLGLGYRGQAKFDSAIIAMNKAIALKPGYSEAYAKLGEIYGQNLGRLDAALEYLQKAVELDPKNASAIENIGIVYGMQRNFERSLEYFNRALILNPDKPDLLMNISQTYLIMGRKDKAAEFMQKAQTAGGNKK